MVMSTGAGQRRLHPPRRLYLTKFQQTLSRMRLPVHYSSRLPNLGLNGSSVCRRVLNGGRCIVDIWPGLPRRVALDPLAYETGHGIVTVARASSQVRGLP